MTQAVARIGGARGLSTARAVLKVLALLDEHLDGVRVADVAAAVGKSTSTAYYLLASLVEEGFAAHDARTGTYRVVNRAPAVERSEPVAAELPRLEAALGELFAQTGKRCYLGRVRQGGIEIVGLRARQGTPRIPGLRSPILGGFHALAMGKVLLSVLPLHARQRYIRRGLTRYTPATVTDPDVLAAQLEAVRRRGSATEREEFQPNFCCIAAPIADPRGHLLALLGLSVTTRGFDTDGEWLVQATEDVARSFSHLQKAPGILRPHSAGAYHSHIHTAPEKEDHSP